MMLITAMPLTEAIEPVRQPHTEIYAAIAAVLVSTAVITYLIRSIAESRNPEIEQTRTVSATVLGVSALGAAIMTVTTVVSALLPTVSQEQIEDSLADDLEQNYQITAAEYDLSGTPLLSLSGHQDWVEGLTDAESAHEARVRVTTEEGHTYLYGVVLDGGNQHAVLQPVSSSSISSAPDPDTLQR